MVPQDPGLRGPADPFGQPRFPGAPAGIAVTPLQTMLQRPLSSAAAFDDTTNMQQVCTDTMSLLAYSFAAQS